MPVHSPNSLVSSHPIPVETCICKWKSYTAININNLHLLILSTNLSQLHSTYSSNQPDLLLVYFQPHLNYSSPVKVATWPSCSRFILFKGITCLPSSGGPKPHKDTWEFNRFDNHVTLHSERKITGKSSGPDKMKRTVASNTTCCHCFLWVPVFFFTLLLIITLSFQTCLCSTFIESNYCIHCFKMSYLMFILSSETVGVGEVCDMAALH